MTDRVPTKRVAGGLVVCALILAACGGAPGESPGGTPGGTDSDGGIQGTLKLAVVAPLTGAQAADGEEMVRGAQLAIEEINEDGGCAGWQFELVEGDTGETPDTATSTIRRLADDEDVVAMFAGYATTTNFEIDLMAELEMPYILSANTAQTEEIISKDPDAYPTVWSTNPNYDAYETVPPEFFEQLDEDGAFTLRSRKVYIVTSDNPYSATISDGLTENFEALGWTVVGGDEVPFGTVSDWRAILAKVRAEDPDVVINTDYLPANGATFMLQFLENPTQSLLFIQYGPSVPEFTDIAGDQATGVLYTLLGGGIESKPQTIEIKEKFEERFGLESGGYGVNLYEQIYVYCDALTVVGDPYDRVAVGQAIGQVQKDISTGLLEFNQDTHVSLQGPDHIPLQFFQIWDGERELLLPEEYATAEFRLPPWIEE